MRISLFFISIFICCVGISAQILYTKTFGKKGDKALIYLHGGPGYNAASFEATSAEKLAEKGFFVIVYDRRGEGRSLDKAASYTFNETFDDINNIYNRYGLKKATLIGHSFGGVVAVLFAEKNLEKVESILLVGAPVSLQKTFKNILQKTKNIYEAKGDSINLKYISMLEKMDSNSLEYSSYCFSHAMQNGFYKPKNPSEEAKILHGKFKTDTLLMNHASKMTYQPPQGFWKNEKYTTLDLTGTIDKLQKEKLPVYGLYGKEDGLYSAKQVMELQHLIGENHMRYFENCSHSVFIDQQQLFIETISEWLK